MARFWLPVALMLFLVLVLSYQYLEVNDTQDSLSGVWQWEPERLANSSALLLSNMSERIINASRVLCWVLTGPTTIDTRGAAILETWGPKCDRLLFMTSEHDKSTLKGKVALPGVGEGRKELVSKSREAWTYVHEHYANQYDWFYKCDDDTYTVVENLKFMLSFLDPAQPFLLGMTLRMPRVKFLWVSGGAGYVLSRAALHKVTRKIKAGCMENPKQPHEDKLVSVCARRAHIRLVSSLDQYGKSRIMPLAPELHLVDGAIAKSDFKWVLKYAAGKRKEIEGKDCCSDLAISFHYIQPAYQRILNYLIYNLHPFGVRKDDDIIRYRLSHRPG